VATKAPGMPDLSGARVVITGANGFIGSHTVLYFESLGAPVVPVDVSPRSPDLSLLPIKTPSELFDIADFGKFSELCKREGVTHIVHLA
jgi:nucleoside-diphosphate-sugar epimerase